MIKQLRGSIAGVITHGERMAATEPDDPTLTALMTESFGPPGSLDNATDERRLERGLDALSDLSVSATGVVWLHEEAHEAAEPLAEPRHCFACGAAAPPSHCAKCGVASYCNRDCQMTDWSAKKGGRWGGHKGAQCEAYKKLGKEQRLATEAARREAVEALLTRVRLYLCPFALAHGSGGVVAGRGGKRAASKARPRGCCFFQIGCTLAQVALPAPRDCAGVALAPGERSALLHFVSLAEFEAEIADTDPALGRARAAVVKAVNEHDDQNEVVVLVRAHCGTTVLVVQPLVPERKVCLQLATEYETQEALQIDLDDPGG